MMLDSLLPLLGVALCAIVIVQFGLWTAQSLSTIRNNQKHFQLSQELLRKQIEQAATRLTEETAEPLAEGEWKGFRQFRVDRLVRETSACTSVYLRPTDGKAICDFLPGQHLTLKFAVPGQTKPVVRCYSLSQAPGYGEYRISVKAVPPPRGNANAPAGLVSNYVNQQLRQGDLVEIKQPSGRFHLDVNSQRPVVLLAGGIGITPLLCMLDYMVAHQPERQVILFYGSRHGNDHAFKSHLAQIQEQSNNVYVINAYSEPVPTDQVKIDFQIKGFVSVDLIQQVLPNTNFDFYMCGPPPFMESVYSGLTEWGIPESQIHFEAFGPASIGKKKSKQSSETIEASSATQVVFSKSNRTVTFDANTGNLLDLAEANGVDVDSGCRAGNCGTCQVAIKSGKVRYPEGEDIECDPGHCLLCVAQPDGPVELEA